MNTFTGDQLKAIPIESLVASPLVAVVDAQKQLSASMYNYIKEVALDENGQVKNVYFNLIGKKSPTSIGGAMNCLIFFIKTMV